MQPEDPYATPQAPPPLPPQQQQQGSDIGTRMLLPVGRSGWAIAAGYLGLISLVVLPAPLALIISIIAILDIQKSKNSPKQKYGMGRAIFGLVMGLIGTAIIALVLLASL